MESPESLFGDESQESVPGYLLGTLDNFREVVINEGDLDSQTSQWSIGGLLEAPVTRAELRIGRSLEPHICPTCSKAFKRRRYLTKHLKTHTGEKPYHCVHLGCGSAFSENSSLTQHMRTHTGERPFPCEHPGCGSAFSRNSSLTQHMRTHTGERPFHCEHSGCGQAFLRKTDLTVHKRIHLGEKPYDCKEPGCNKTFVKKKHRDTHAWTHRPMMSCPVEGCLTMRSASYQMKHHIKQKHPGWQPGP